MSLSHSRKTTPSFSSHRYRKKSHSSVSPGFGLTAAVLLVFMASTSWCAHWQGFYGSGAVTTMAFSSPESSASGRRSMGVGQSRTAINGANGANGEIGYTFRDSWSLITLGDLHMEDDMTYHEQARRDCLKALEDFPILGAPTKTDENGTPANSSLTVQSFSELSKETLDSICQTPGGELTEEELQLLLARKRNKYLRSHIVSLGDLGRKDIRHEQGDAGTTKSFTDAKAYFDGFEGISYDLVTGNHDLEGLDEFDTDEANLQAWMDCFNLEKPCFSRKIGERTLLLGLSTVRFRDAPYSSHEVHVDHQQIEWFRNMVESHPELDGWKILVFSHAPIIGSGLRVLQSVHIMNGCAWLNHCSPPYVRNSFVRIVRDNPQIKCWLSGHFHLSHDYQDALVQPVPGSPCAFLQVGVMGPASSRDQKRQSRMIRGCGGEFLQFFSTNHHDRIAEHSRDGSPTTKAQVRLDATIDHKTGTLTYAEDDNDASDVSNSDKSPSKAPSWVQVYVSQSEDGCYLEDPVGSIISDLSKNCVDGICPTGRCWVSTRNNWSNTMKRL